MSAAPATGAIERANAAYWNELCGSGAARALGIRDASPASLARFDAWYFGFYPYLARHLDAPACRDRDVLEVGLGYGTVAQHLAAAGARYTGLDIAAGPVAMVRHRLQAHGLPGRAVRGSILDAPFADASFDRVVAIGSLHHTGDVAAAIAEARRVLRPGGTLVMMVYNAYSYRRWLRAPRATLALALRETLRGAGALAAREASERAAYDVDSAGVAAPSTEFLGRRAVAALCAGFAGVRAVAENASVPWPLGERARAWVLRSGLPRLAGLDLYVHAVR